MGGLFFAFYKFSCMFTLATLSRARFLKICNIPNFIFGWCCLCLVLSLAKTFDMSNRHSRNIDLTFRLIYANTNLLLSTAVEAFIFCSPRKWSKRCSTQKEGMARLGLYKAEILLKPTINEVDFRLHEFKLYLPNLALTSLLSPWWLNYPHARRYEQN